MSLTENLHISAFLNGHGGPGLQHIGLHTSCITQCVDYMSLRNVLFRKSPTAYYKNVGCISNNEITAIMIVSVISA